MKIICLARWDDEKGKKLAEALASKLGYSCYSREALTDEATETGIAVGKLETAVLKPGLFNERLQLEKDRYIAFATARLCEKALEGDVVYHGRTGHLLLPGVSHMLKIRVEQNIEERIKSAMLHLKLPREKAKAYAESVDEDIRKWVKTQYGKEWESSAHYDIVINLDQMEVNNAATALCSIATLPEFQVTPASRQALENLYLAARVRSTLGNHERTRTGRFHVIAREGKVVITYQPQDLAMAEAITSIALTVKDVQEVHTTMATSNLLWVQGRFDPQSKACQEIVKMAQRWNVAVDLLHVKNSGDAEAPMIQRAAAPNDIAATESRESNGGIEDDLEHSATCEDNCGLTETQQFLMREGVAGGTSVACGLMAHLSECMDTNVKYMLVVLGELFMDKNQATRTRLTRELSGTLHEALRVPVISVDELKQAYTFTFNEALKLLGYLAIVTLVFVLVFTNQVDVLRFLSMPTTFGKIVATASIFVVTPFIAYFYGSFAKGFFKLIRLE